MPAKDTTKLLAKLRNLMKDVQLLNGIEYQAYIIPSSDAHGSEYLSNKDKRRQFISGFQGSSGTAVVTQQNALLWTDGRYFLQATKQLDSNWQLMKDGLEDTPSIAEWLTRNLPTSSFVGIDARLYEEDLFVALANKLKTNKLELVHNENNLIDLVWNDCDEKRELDGLKPLIKLNVNHFGKTTREKLKKLRDQMNKLNTNAVVVTSLDEIAWLLNLRGRDIPYGTVFFAYCLITLDDCKLFTDLNRLKDNNEDLISYLSNEDKFEFYEYNTFYTFFKDFVNKEFVDKFKNETIKKKIYLSSSSNHAIHSIVPSEFVHKDLSYLNKLKVIKNSNEIESSKRIHLKDSAILVEFLYRIQTHFSIDKTQSVTNPFNFDLNEYNLAKYVDEMRATNGCLTPSFETICSYGSNGAIIHYKPDKNDEGLKNVKENDFLLLDSGGHYLDLGTTDVTRTVFLGDCSKITDYQRECFTRVLKGHIQLALRVFPNGTRAELLDSFARQNLWQVGLDYRHGTGHGVGALLNVHELPIIANRKSVEIPLQENMIVTIEPGYYEDEKFGIRIENCVLITKCNTKYKYSNNIEFVQFEPLTHVPIQRELIDKSLLNSDELNWLNSYHESCATLIGNELLKNGKTDIHKWLLEQTKPL